MELALDYLAAQSFASLAQLFWFTLVLELPRYALSFLAIGLVGGWIARRAEQEEGPVPASASLPALVLSYVPATPQVSVVVVGHNEVNALERCLRSLREQTLLPMEVIVVSDGSSDGMPALAAGLVRQGLARHALATDLRGGKSAGMNLALRFCRGDVVVNVDCDCSYDRFALENIVAPFANPAVGAVSGDIVPRNGACSLFARLQQVEYLISISVGRRVADALGQVACVSGAFGAFRRAALVEAGGCDVGGGEDLDLTLRLRAAGWRTVFAPRATCYTDVPCGAAALVRQRLRWERDALRLRLRKHRRTLLGQDRRAGPAEAVHQWDFLVFELAATVAFPIYLAWLFTQYGALALPVLVAMQAGLLLLDLAMLAVAALVAPRAVPVVLLAYLPGYSVYSGFLMRFVRLFAYLQEWFLYGSRHDNYVPAAVRRVRRW